MRLSTLVWAAVLAGSALPAAAQTAQTYLYDANGRLIAATTARSSTGEVVPYALDDADNRTGRRAFGTVGPTAADRLTSLQTIVPTQKLTNGAYAFTFQPDGDLVVSGPSGLIWHSCTATGRSAYLRMDANGDLVLRDPDFATLWHSNTAGNPGAELALLGTGALVIRTGATIHWTATGSCF